MIQVCNAMTGFKRFSSSQAGGVLAKMSMMIFLLALLIGAAAILYLGTASMPAPSQSIQKPIPDAQIKKRS
jgi:hypothetical protein